MYTKSDKENEDRNMIVMGKNMVVVGNAKPHYIFNQWNGEEWLECWKVLDEGNTKKLDYNIVKSEYENSRSDDIEEGNKEEL